MSIVTIPAPILLKGLSYPNVLLKYFASINLSCLQSQQSRAFSFYYHLSNYNGIYIPFWCDNFSWVTWTFFNKYACTAAFKFCCPVFYGWKWRRTVPTNFNESHFNHIIKKTVILSMLDIRFFRCSNIAKGCSTQKAISHKRNPVAAWQVTFAKQIIF